MAMALETTMILLKPDAIEKHLTGKVLARFEDAGFVIRAIKMMQYTVNTTLRKHVIGEKKRGKVVQIERESERGKRNKETAEDKKQKTKT